MIPVGAAAANGARETLSLERSPRNVGDQALAARRVANVEWRGDEDMNFHQWYQLHVFSILIQN